MHVTAVDLILLGSPRVEQAGRPVATETRKALALLAFLAVQGDATRDRLAALLWPEADAGRARGSLRRTLTGIRTVLGDDVVSADRRTVALRDSVRCDVHSFRSALAAARGHGHDDSDVCPQCLPHLDAVLARYGGDFLDGFSIDDAPQFEDWARAVTEGLRLDAARAAERLAAGRAAEGDYAAATAAAQRWIDLDVLHEPAHRYLMLLGAWAGDRAGAIEAYRRCAAVLDAELGVPPLEETTELYEAILDDDLPPAPSTRRRVQARAAAKPMVSPARLIGRAGDLDRLEQGLIGSADAGRLIALRGEAWMGKTRLVDEMSAIAARRGHPLLDGRGFRAEQSLPFGVVTQLLRAALATPATAAALRAAPPWALYEAGRLVPDVLAQAGAGPGDFGVPDELAGTRLFDGLRVVLGRLGEPAPVVVTVDDAQWADASSWSFLTYLARRLEEMRLLLVIAYRPPLPDDSTLRELLRTVAGSAELVLHPLGAADVAPLVDGEEAAAAIVARTGGIPLLVAEHLADPSADLTPGVRQYMETHLSGLDGLATQVLAAAAVLGSSSGVELLRETSGRSEGEVVDAVETLVRTGILEEKPAPGAFGFTLDAVERLVYGETAPIRRRLLHRRAAAALSQHRGSVSDARAATAVAVHHREAGSDGDAAQWYARAGDLSRAVFAHAEAAASYHAALALGHPRPEVLHTALGELAMLSGRYREALGEFGAAVARAAGPERATAEHRLGETHRRLGNFDLAQHHFELAEPDHPAKALLYADWALLHLRRGDRIQAAQAAVRSREAADEAGDGLARARALNIMGIVPDDPDSARGYLEEAVRLSAEDPVGRMAALNSLAFHLAGRGEVGGAIPLVGEALELAQLVGDRHREAALRNHLADLLHRAGREDESRRALTEAVQLFTDLEDGAWQPEVWLLTRW